MDSKSKYYGFVVFSVLVIIGTFAAITLLNSEGVTAIEHSVVTLEEANAIVEFTDVLIIRGKDGSVSMQVGGAEVLDENGTLVMHYDDNFIFVESVEVNGMHISAEELLNMI